MSRSPRHDYIVGIIVLGVASFILIALSLSARSDHLPATAALAPLGFLVVIAIKLRRLSGPGPNA